MRRSHILILGKSVFIVGHCRKTGAILRKSSLFLSLCLLAGCGVVEQLTLPLKSDAYKLGYQVGVELQEVALGVADINNVFSQINEWTDAYLTDLEGPDFDLAETCEGLFELSGLAASLQGFSIDNSPENKLEFSQGCVAGFDS
jgi:hypothetical protein